MHEHIFTSCDKDGYEYCEGCGTYHSIAQVDPVELYENQEYWSYDNKRSKIEEQISNLTCTDECGISKVDRIFQFVPETGRNALEIACAPGVMLNMLTERGFETVGIEPSERYVQFISNQAPKARVIRGYFPQVFGNELSDFFDVIIGSDIMEHIEDYKGFFDGIHRLLVQGGTAIFMSPIILEDGLYRERDLKADEHCWIHSKKYLEPYLQSMFSEVKFAFWILGHNIIILKK